MMYKVHTHIRSPNYEARYPDTTIDFLIMHYTACDLEASLKILTDPNARHRVSAHYLVDETGEVYALVDEEFRSWHAGKSAWRDLADMNSRSVGIEIVNPGQGPNYRPFPPLQMESVASLSKEIITRWRMAPHHVLGHSDIAPGRKVDPGPLFDWKWLAGHGVGVYPDIQKNQERQSREWKGQERKSEKEPLPLDKRKEKQLDIIRIQHLLARYGYTVPLSGILDPQTRAVIEAFQMHFWPESILEKFRLMGCRSVKETLESKSLYVDGGSRERQHPFSLSLEDEGILDGETSAGLIRRLESLIDSLDNQPCANL
ncbi:MAG: N-acetylmuramoyl-L-alanine amidase [Caedimonas sp.]|nr:N-acetylmuramoyl-L-alanine amidase [Caedimonas sp.]